MTGVLNAMVGLPLVKARYIISVGEHNTDLNGYNSGTSAFEPTPTGSISPSSTYSGASIYWILSDDDTADAFDFQIHLSGSRASDFFDGVRVIRSDGQVATLLTADATVEPTADSGTRWKWPSESTVIWDDSAISTTKIVDFF